MRGIGFTIWHWGERRIQGQSFFVVKITAKFKISPKHRDFVLSTSMSSTNISYYSSIICLTDDFGDTWNKLYETFWSSWFDFNPDIVLLLIFISYIWHMSHCKHYFQTQRYSRKHIRWMFGLFLSVNVNMKIKDISLLTCKKGTVGYFCKSQCWQHKNFWFKVKSTWKKMHYNCTNFQVKPIKRCNGIGKGRLCPILTSNIAGAHINIDIKDIWNKE